MKRLFILASAAALLLASCAKTTVVYNEAPEEIGFKAVTGVMTKAVLEDLGESNNSTMGVFAEHNPGSPASVNSYFDNKSFAYDDAKSAWTGSQYWPIQGTLDFTFYSPRMATGVEYYDDTKKLSLTIPDNQTAQIDYLYGKTRPMGQTKNTNSGNVAIELKHALAKIMVQVKADKNDVYTVNSITLNNTVQSGKVDVIYEDDGSGVTSVNLTPGVANVANTYNFIETSPLAITTTLSELTSYYYVFPGTIPTSLTIVYTIGEIENLTGTVSLVSGEDKWESGKQYVYNLNMTATEILVTPTVVDDWGTGDVNGSYEVQ